MKNLRSINLGRYSRILTGLIVLLAIVSIALGWLYFKVHAWVTFINALMLWLILVGLIMYQIRKVNRDLTRFFQMVQAGESTEGFNLPKSDPLFRDLHRQMNEIIENLGNVRREKERDFLFFKSIFDHADVGLLVYDDGGKITLINQSAQVLLGITSPKEARDIHIADSSGDSLLKDIRPGRKTLLKLDRNGETVQLSLRSQRIKISGQNNTLLSVQNIRQELEQHEVESWQRLIRVFIHEIMNSVSPITLTASGIIAMLETPLDKESSGPQQQHEILNALHAIRKRSKGLSSFMESYKQLAQIPTPDLNKADVGRMAENIGLLMHHDFQQRNVSFFIRLSQREIKLWCDEKLVEQALINLLRNAAEALVNTPEPVITLSSVSLHDRVEIIIQDNGPGIDPGIIENIFVPFFTTRTEGSGIGLSLSRQIVNLHGGRISVHSKPGETFFTLSFPVISND